jgi:hypothetical protein
MQYPWIESERQFFGRRMTDYDFESMDPAKSQDRLRKLQDEQQKLAKKINKKVRMPHKSSLFPGGPSTSLVLSTHIPATECDAIFCSGGGHDREGGDRVLGARAQAAEHRERQEEDRGETSLQS